MDSRFLTTAAIAVAGVALLALVVARAGRAGQPVKGRARRATGHALLGLQEFIEPSVEYVVQARNVESTEEDDDDGLGADEPAIRADLADALGRSPVDPEEVRRHLAAAARAGLDWRALFEQAAGDELRARPYRAPELPPARRVAPRE